MDRDWVDRQTRSVNGQFGGQLSYDWRPEVLVVCLSVPMERLASVEGEIS
jgi:hypothetical protein